jgi:hypothetical protein
MNGTTLQEWDLELTDHKYLAEMFSLCAKQSVTKIHVLNFIPYLSPSK